MAPSKLVNHLHKPQHIQIPHTRSNEMLPSSKKSKIWLQLDTSYCLDYVQTMREKRDGGGRTVDYNEITPAARCQKPQNSVHTQILWETFQAETDLGHQIETEFQIQWLHQPNSETRHKSNLKCTKWSTINEDISGEMNPTIRKAKKTRLDAYPMETPCYECAGMDMPAKVNKNV